MSGIASGRLKEERKNWRKDHPYGFYARPTSSGDGSTGECKWCFTQQAGSLEEYDGLTNIPLHFLFSDIMKWEAGVPGTGRTCSWCCLVEFLSLGTGQKI